MVNEYGMTSDILTSDKEHFPKFVAYMLMNFVTFKRVQKFTDNSMWFWELDGRRTLDQASYFV